MEFKDYYAVLGVERTATQDELKRAYRKLARKHHPDLNKAPQAEERFKEVAEAHEALIDPERRAAYDALQQRHDRGESWAPSQEGEGAGQDTRTEADLSDFFASLFGRNAGPASARGHAGGGATWS